MIEKTLIRPAPDPDPSHPVPTGPGPLITPEMERGGAGDPGVSPPQNRFPKFPIGPDFKPAGPPRLF